MEIEDMAGRSDVHFPDEARFMGYAALVMRNRIINYAHDRQAQKRGGLFIITSLENEDVNEPANVGHLSEIAFSFAEIGAMRNQPGRTVQRNWQKAQIFLHRELNAYLSA
jgi:hypothetical protein